MSEQQRALITELSWGEIEISVGGVQRRYRDAKIWPGGAREWDWNETGTDHGIGIQKTDVREVVEHGAEIVILSRGQNRRLQVHKDTIRFLEERGVEYHIEETRQAVELFNRLSRQGEAVGGVFHSTC